MNTKSIVKTNSISKYFKQNEGYFCSLKDISIEIPEGEIVCILGPSGSGKSTLLNIMAGIMLPSEGSVTFDGVDYEFGFPVGIKKRIGVVFQTDNLLPWRSVGDNLHLGLELLKLNGMDWEKRINEQLEAVGLLAYKDALPHELSGGMRQRVGIARALTHDPEILLMDQPFNALDAITKKIISYSFLDMWLKNKKSVVFITNDIDEALLLGQKIYLLSASPATVERCIDVSSLPIEARDEHVEKHPEYQRLKNIIRSLHIKTTIEQSQE